MPTWFWLAHEDMPNKERPFAMRQRLGQLNCSQGQEPLKNTWSFLQMILFHHLHMAAALELADAMVTAKTTGVAYETVRDLEGTIASFGTNE